MWSQETGHCVSLGELFAKEPSSLDFKSCFGTYVVRRCQCKMGQVLSG